MKNIALHKKTIDDKNEYLRTGKSPLSFFNDESTLADLVSRYQSVFANTDSKVYDKTTNKILNDVKPLTEDEKYSAFAIKKHSYIKSMVYPLTSPYLSNNVNFDIDNYEALKDEFKKSFKVKVVEKSRLASLWQYKKRKNVFKGILYHAQKGLKLCTTALTFGKLRFTYNPIDRVKGKIKLRSYNQIANAPYTKADKITKLYNIVAEQTINKLYKKNKISTSNPDIIKLVSSLISTQYVAVASNYGTTDVSKAIYTSLSVQISNALASMGNITQNDKEVIKKLSSQTTELMLKKLNKTPENIVENMKSIGFDLKLQANSNITDVIFADYKPQEIYLEQEDNKEIKETENEVNPLFENDIPDVIYENELQKNIVKKFNQKINLLDPNKTKMFTVNRTNKLKRKTAMLKIDNAVCETLAKMIENYNNKLVGDITDRKRKNITAQRDFISTLLEHYEIVSYDFTKSSLNVIKQEAKANGVKCKEDIAKLISLHLVKVRNNVLDKYFDEKYIKNEYNDMTYSKIINNEMGKALDKQKKDSSSFKTVVKNYALKLMKLALAKEKRATKSSPTLAD